MTKSISAPSGFRSGISFSLFCMAAAFITYCSMYAYRKPVSAGVFADLKYWGIDYKILLLTAQAVGYTLSKFIGIKMISEMAPQRRIFFILMLIGMSWLALLLFALTPHPWNFIWLFFNGLPLGMIWGLVFAFLEGRRNTELLGVGMSVSFIVASGLVKAGGKYLIESFGVSEFWMPFMTGLMFIPPLLLGVWMLRQIPPPTQADIEQRSERAPMDKQQRRLFFRSFAPGIILMVLVYVALTIFRDLRDNFSVELWSLLGYPNTPRVLVTAEIPIAAGVFVIIGLMVYIRNNRKAFYGNLAIIMSGGLILMLSTALFEMRLLNPVAWMILVGFGMYLSYVSYHTMLFERWIALFRHKSNIGYLMYTADAFGYLGSVGILFFKNFGNREMNWLNYIIKISYIIGLVTVLCTVMAWVYFRKKERRG